MRGDHRGADWAAILRVAARQHGLITVRQAHDFGLASTTLGRLCDRQGWDRVTRGVVALPGSVDRPERRVAALVLRIGSPAAVTGWTAAWLHGLRTARPARTEMLLPANRRSPRLAGVTIRRTSVWRDDHLTTARDLPVVTVARMICDLGAVATADALRPLFLDARQRRMVTVEGVAETTAALGTAGGLARVREMLTTLGTAIADSELEWRWRRLLDAHGFRPDSAPAYVPVSGGRLVQVDIPFSPFKVGLETDGRGYHADRGSLDTDALRHNGLMATGWIVLRATWTHLRAPGEVLVALGDALRGRGWSESSS